MPRSGAAPVVTVIIPVRDDLDGLRACLEALADQTFPADQTEIIVVDDGSTPPIADALGGAASVRVLRVTPGGSYAARNAALAVARGELLAFTDADCRPLTDWLANGVATFRARPECGLLAGHIEVTTAPRPSIAERYESVAAFRQADYAADHFAATANCWVRRTIAEAVGGFDARLQSGGDADFGTRVHAAGYQVCYAADVVVRHPARTLGPLLKKQARVGAGLRDRHASQPPGRRAVARLAVVRLLPFGNAVKVMRRLPAGTSLPDRLRVGLLTVGVRQLYFWSYLRHTPRTRPAPGSADATGEPPAGGDE